MNASLSLGAQGEAHAAHYLLQQGYHILHRNWRCQRGELDLIAQQTTLDGNGIWVFVEVKSSRSADNEQARANLTPRKLARCVASAQVFLDQHALSEVQWRLDVILVGRAHSSVPLIEHVEDALAW